MRTKDPNIRQQILDTAGQLFNEHGYRAVGVELVLEKSGFAKATLYRHFKGKDALVAAYLARRGESHLAWLKQSVERAKGSKLVAIFDALEKWFRSPDFYGCSFIHAVSEYPDPGHEVRQTVDAVMNAMQDWLTELTTEEKLEQPKAKARQFLLLIEGAKLRAEATRTPAPAREAKAVAQALLNTARDCE